jgi:hypothetical protein
MGAAIESRRTHQSLRRRADGQYEYRQQPCLRLETGSESVDLLAIPYLRMFRLLARKK